MSDEMNAKEITRLEKPGNFGASPEVRTIALFCVLSQFLCYFTGFGGLIAPLIIWLIKKDSSAFIDEIGKETLNFQITILILAFISGILCWVLIGFLLIPILGLYALIAIIIAAVKASDGVVFRYPICFRFLR